MDVGDSTLWSGAAACAWSALSFVSWSYVIVHDDTSAFPTRLDELPCTCTFISVNRSAHVCWCTLCLTDRLRVGRSGDRIPVREGRFSLPVQNSHEVHLAFCTMDVRSFAGLKWLERDAGQPYPSSFEDASGVNLYLCACIKSSWGDLSICLQIASSSRLLLGRMVENCI